MKTNKPLVVFDLETTGIWIEKDRIVEIGMIKIMPGGARETYIKRVNPGIPIPPNVTRIINITNDDVKNEPPFKDIARQAYDFIGDADIGGFNVLRFDLPMLEREFQDAGISFHWKDRTVYDAQKIYHIHEKRDLTAAYQFYCNKGLENAHTALGDAEATADILEAQIDLYGDKDDGVGSLRDIEYEKQSDYFDAERKFCWWNGELYPMFGKHARKTSLKDIVLTDRPYLNWILDKDFSDEVKSLVRGAIKGDFPKPPSNG